MNKKAVLHIPMSQYAFALDEERMVFRLRTARGDMDACRLYYGDRSCRQTPVIFDSVLMKVAAQDELFDYYETEFVSPYRRLCYYFPYMHRDDLVRPPQWMQDAVVYNIFPDSFASGKGFISNEESRKEFHGKTVRGKRGGTLRGITENIGYLKELGFNTLYMNPIFAAGEYHKYDLIDYFHVDPCFGRDEDFRELVDTCHGNGMRVIIDGVFNHCGWQWDKFGDVVDKGKDSQYSDWFYRLEYPVCRPEDPEVYPDYECFGYERMMPKLATDREAVADYFCRVCRYWLEEFHIDGWRLDVVHMLGEAGGARNNMQHVAGITEAAKETQPEAYIVGEHFGDARQWLQADVEDAAMNYRGFTFPLWGFLANTDISYDPQQIDAQTCMAWMDNYRAGLSHQQQLRMFNQLDSHDTARFKTLLGRDIARLPLAVVWLFTWPGVPCIYYGDEVGLDGKNDPFCRKPFPWQVEKQDTALFALYQRMIALRKKSQALRHGGCQVLYAEDNVVVFVRVLNQQRVLVAINRGEACEVVLPASPFLNAVQWQCKEGHGQLTDGILALPAISATVWMN